MGIEVAVVGAGRWGSALGQTAARNGHTVTLWSPRKGLPDVEGCRRTQDLADVAGKRAILFTVPPEHARTIARELAAHVGPDVAIVHGVRGLADEPVSTIGDVLQQETCVRRIGALGGPVLVSELEDGSPTLFVCGSPFPEVLLLAKELLGSKSTRVATTPDRRGVEWSSVLVACLTLGVGYVQGAGFGPGLVSAVTSEAVREAARFVVAAGGQEATMLGLAGNGDLLAAMAQEGRPEVIVGRTLASGKSVDEAEKAIGQRVVATDLAPKLLRWAEAHKVSLPLLGSLARGAFSGKPARDVVTSWIERAL
jgi:glycerol-3-phosphate dehydrogenase (NAD(P)+)